MIVKTLCLVTLAAATGVASSPAIGVITASGHFSVDRSEIWGNTTLFDGAQVETKAASSELALRNGVQIQLGAPALAGVWENRVALERGVGQVATALASPGFEIDARGLSIHPAAGGSRVRVGVSGENVQVSALAGSARVEGAGGALLALIPAGQTRSFMMQAANGAVSLSGCLLYKDGHFLMQDENTQEVVELTGTGLAANLGNRVDMTGIVGTAKPALSGASRVLSASSVALKQRGGCLSVAASLSALTQMPAAPASTPAAGGTTASTTSGSTGTSTAAKTGMSAGAKAAIVVVAAGGGAGAAILVAGRKKSTSP